MSESSSHRPEKYCRETQYYKGVPITLIVYTERHFAALKAKRFMLGPPGTSQNIWIPNKYLEPDGRIKSDADIDWIMRRAWAENKFKYAGIGIDPRTWTPADPAVNAPPKQKGKSPWN